MAKVQEVKIDPKAATSEQIAAGLAMLGKEETRKKRVKAGELKSQKYSDLSDEQKGKRNEATRRRNARLILMTQKAEEAGLSCTNAEIDAYLA